MMCLVTYAWLFYCLLSSEIKEGFVGKNLAEHNTRDDRSKEQRKEKAATHKYSNSERAKKPNKIPLHM